VLGKFAVGHAKLRLASLDVVVAVEQPGLVVGDALLVDLGHGVITVCEPREKKL